MRSTRLILLTLIGLLVISAALPIAAAEDAPADPAETADDAETLIALERGFVRGVGNQPAVMRSSRRGPRSSSFRPGC